MSYNILNKGVNFQGATQGTIEDIVDTHSTQTIGGLKTVTHLTGTHVRITNDATVLGNVSASINISASAFYGDGANLNNVGATINSAVANRITTVATNTDHLDGEPDLTFNSSNKTLELATSGAPTGIFNLYGTLSGSGDISGSAFFGSGEGLTGIPGSAVSIASGGGLTDSSGLKLDAGVDAVDSLATADKILIFDAGSGDAVKRTTAGAIANLFDPAVSTFNGDVNNRVITAGGSEVINGEANLTFDDSTSRLTVTGDVSGSGFVSASIGHFVTKVESAAIGLTDASGISGAGLVNNSGLLDVQVSGAIKIASDKLGITGSFAGNGLIYDGGVDSISNINVELQTNSGLSVDGSGLKLDTNSLASGTPDAAADSLVFIDSNASSASKKMTFDNLAAALAGNGLDNSSGTLVLDLTEAGLGAVADCILTDNGNGSVTPESNLKFSSNTLTFGNGSHPTASVAVASGTDTAGKSLIIQTGAGTGTGGGGSVIFKTTEALGGSGTTVQDYITAGAFTKRAFTVGGEETEQATKTSIVAKKANINHNSYTGFVKFTIPNDEHAAGFKIHGVVTRAQCDTAMGFTLIGAISRVGSATAFAQISSVTTTNNAGDGSDGQRLTGIAFQLASVSGGTGGVQTVDVQVRGQTNDSSNDIMIVYTADNSFS
jgi:hypothetical protein